MIKTRRNCKEIERKSFGAKTGQKQGKNRGLRDFAASAKSTLCCEISSQPQAPLCKNFLSCETNFGTECHFAAQWLPFCSCETAANHQSMKDPIFAGKAPFRRGFRSCEATFWHTSAILQHNDPYFAAVKRLRSIKNSQFRSQSPILQGVLQLRNHPLAHECHFEAP